MRVPVLCALLFVLNAGQANALSAPTADFDLSELINKVEATTPIDDTLRVLPIKEFDFEHAAKEMLRAKYKFAAWMNVDEIAKKALAVEEIALEHVPHDEHGPEHRGPPPPPGHPRHDSPPHDGPPSPHPPHDGPHDGPHHHHRHGKHGKHEHGPPPFLCRLRRYMHHTMRTVKSFFVGHRPCHHAPPPPPPHAAFASPDFLPVEISAEMMANSHTPRPDAGFVLAMIATKFFLLFALTFHLARRYRRRAEGAIRLREEESIAVSNEKVEIVIV